MRDDKWGNHVSSLYKQYNQLNAYEKAYLGLYPHHIMAIKGSVDKAYKETTARFGYNSRNDESDSFRHCFWSALLAKEIGYFNAIMFTTAHEMGESNPKNEKEMDLWNNKIGAEIGKSKLEESMLSIKCMKALKSGRLKVIKK